MPRPPKARPEVDLEAFFAGVADVRAHLDRHIQDPSRRRARLGKLASELMRPRPPRELCNWLTAQLADAVGAYGATLHVHDGGGWRPVSSSGQSRTEPALDDLSDDGAEAKQLAGGLLVPLVGLDGLVGAVWLEAAQPLDEASRTLVEAIAGTTGIMIEQGLLLQEL